MRARALGGSGINFTPRVYMHGFVGTSERNAVVCLARIVIAARARMCLWVWL